MLSKTLLNHQWVTEEIKDDIKKKCLKVNENMLIQNLWDGIKAVLRGKFTAIQTYLRKLEKS